LDLDPDPDISTSFRHALPVRAPAGGKYSQPSLPGAERALKTTMVAQRSQQCLYGGTGTRILPEIEHDR
jgi:hypothetical protein